MGGKSSKYLSQHELNVYLENIDGKISRLQGASKDLKNDVMKISKTLKADLKSLYEESEKQRHCIITLDGEIQDIKETLTGLSELENIRQQVQDLAIKQNSDQKMVTVKVKAVISRERKNWDNGIDELRDRYETVKRHSDDLLSMDLTHERELHDLCKRISALEERIFLESDGEIQSGNLTERRKTLQKICCQDEEEKIKFLEDSVQLKFSKVSQAIKKLKGNINSRELENSNRL